MLVTSIRQPRDGVVYLLLCMIHIQKSRILINKHMNVSLTLPTCVSSSHDRHGWSMVVVVVGGDGNRRPYALSAQRKWMCARPFASPTTCEMVELKRWKNAWNKIPLPLVLVCVWQWKSHGTFYPFYPHRFNIHANRQNASLYAFVWLVGWSISTDSNWKGWKHVAAYVPYVYVLCMLFFSLAVSLSPVVAAHRLCYWNIFQKNAWARSWWGMGRLRGAVVLHIRHTYACLCPTCGNLNVKFYLFRCW